MGTKTLTVAASPVSHLVEKARSGDTHAYDELVALYKDRIYNYVSRMVHDPIEAEDITQDAFIKAYRNLPSFRGASTFQTWLYRIASNLTIDSVRRRRRRENTCSLDAPLDTEEGAMPRDQEDTHELGPDRSLETAELQRHVHQAIQSLTPKLRSVVVLYELQGLSYEEIALILGCPLGTVKSRLFNARTELKLNLANLLSGDVGHPIQAKEPTSKGKTRQEITITRCGYWSVYAAFANLDESCQWGTCLAKPEAGPISFKQMRGANGSCRDCHWRSHADKIRLIDEENPECGYYQGDESHSGSIRCWQGTCRSEREQVTYAEMMDGEGKCSNCASRNFSQTHYAELRRNQYWKRRKKEDE